MNNSISKRFVDWPTSWPSGSFRAGPTALLSAVVVLMLAFGIYEVVLSSSSSIDQKLLGNPLVVVESLGLTLIAEGVLALIVLVSLPWASRLSLRALGYREILRTNENVAYEKI